MNYYLLLFLSLFTTTIISAQELKYPLTPKQTSIKDYHGIQINDPYTWMENVDDEKLKTWAKKQDQLLLDQVRKDPSWGNIRNTIERLSKTGDSHSIPFEVEGSFYYVATVSGAKFGKLYRKGKDKTAPELLLDPGEYYKEEASIRGYMFSPNGRYALFFEREGQPRWGYLRIFDTQKKELLPDRISGVRTLSGFWKEDESGFYYDCSGDTEALNERSTEPVASVRFHSLGESTENDKIVYSDPAKPDLIVGLNSSNDYKNLIIHTWEGRSDRNGVLLLSTSTNELIKLKKNSDSALNFIGNKGENYFFYSNEGAPNGKVVMKDIRGTKDGNFRTVIPNSDKILAGGSSAGGNAMNLVEDKLVLLYRYGTHQYLKIYDLKGKEEHSIELETGWIGSGIVSQPKGSGAWFTLNTFLEPSTVYRLDLESGKYAPFFENSLPIKQEEYVTRNTYYISHDGTKVPIYIAHKKGLQLDGNNPIFMYAYGFGGWVAVPWYQSQMLTWLEMEGVYVLAGVRGGGEFGDEWREAGTRLNRQNAIDDYIAAAEFLIQEKYTSAGKMVANGWSASGSLAAAVVMQRPDIFGAGLIGIPSLDMLKYHNFSQFKGWTSGFGSSDNIEEFNALYRWSPYHNIKMGTCYPPMLVTVGEKDPVTPPQHGYKYVAAMQAAQQDCPLPIMLKVAWGAGHGFGITTKDREDTYADELVFLGQALGMKMINQDASDLKR